MMPDLVRVKAFTGAILICCFVCVYPESSAQGDRIALVIGVNAYKNVPPLINPLNDARDLASALSKKGFQVIFVNDPQTKSDMQSKAVEFFNKLKGKKDAVGFFFFSGHGIQLNGENYLIPSGADLQSEADLDKQTMTLTYVMRLVDEAENGLNIFVLDACRRNSFRAFNRSAEKGLASVDAPSGSYLFYSANPGQIAPDLPGNGGRFASSLIKYINQGGLPIEEVFRKTALEVSVVTGDQQRPWLSTSYTGDFYFAPPVAGKDNVQINPSGSGSAAPPVRKSGVAFDYGYGQDDAPVVVIGSQVWLAKNVNAAKFRNGAVIPEARTEAEWKQAGADGKPVWSTYQLNSNNGARFGKLYNWYAVTDKRGICPAGWHVPSDKEWQVLINQTGGNSSAGSELKSSEGWYNNGNGTSGKGFEALPGGFRMDNGEFDGIGEHGYWWTSSLMGFRSSAHVHLNYVNQFTGFGESQMEEGLSVRCVKD